jgi:2-desacetyl-2-hydroxyethyl bacteriochlorophyllide A dehydrogenase
LGTILKIYGIGDVRFDEYEERKLKPNEVRLKTLFSGISAGTELTHYRGTNPYSHRKWNEELRIFCDGENTEYYPRGTGYEEVGEVTEIGADVAKVKVGDVVYGSWSHKSTNIVDESTAFQKKLPDGLEPVNGIFAQIGAIAYNGILDAQINVGETVLISGQGTVGLICTQLAHLSGARVIAVDLHNMRRDLAKKMGADIVINPVEVDVGKAVKEITNGRGADVCIEASGVVDSLRQAVKACAYCGKVVALGFYQKDAAGLYLGEEFHHNRIGIVCSQIGGINPNLLYRWDMQRLYSTIMEMQKENKLKLKDLITHYAEFRDAPALYKIIDKNPTEVLQAVLKF